MTTGRINQIAFVSVTDNSPHGSRERLRPCTGRIPRIPRAFMLFHRRRITTCTRGPPSHRPRMRSGAGDPPELQHANPGPSAGGRGRSETNGRVTVQTINVFEHRTDSDRLRHVTRSEDRERGPSLEKPRRSAVATRPHGAGRRFERLSHRGSFLHTELNQRRAPPLYIVFAVQVQQIKSSYSL